jgi:hypothetical protein
MPEITLLPVSPQQYEAHLLALCERETDLMLRRQFAADRQDWQEVSRILKEQSLVVCDIARAVDRLFGREGGH